MLDKTNYQPEIIEADAENETAEIEQAAAMGHEARVTLIQKLMAEFARTASALVRMRLAGGWW